MARYKMYLFPEIQILNKSRPEYLTFDAPAGHLAYLRGAWEGDLVFGRKISVIPKKNR